MEGPSGGYRPRTAGERSGNHAGDGSGIRDWQRNTWFGPAPPHTDPFEEPEDAPELKESRSENVNEHVGDFWRPQEEMTGAAGNVPRAAETREKNRKGTHAAFRPRKLAVIAGTAVFLIAVLLVLRFAVFSVSEIQVIGNNQIPAGEVIRISGIRRGDNILTLSEKHVEQKITSDYRLQFRFLEKKLPSMVLLSVREREPCCWLSYCGIYYVMDKTRMVLFETENPAQRPANLVEVKGLDIRSNTLVGQYINLGSGSQESIFSELFLEMKVLGCTEEIQEADISNTESVLLATRDGYTVSLGGKENLHAKLRSMLLVREELHRMGMTGGTINVTNPETPIYSP